MVHVSLLNFQESSGVITHSLLPPHQSTQTDARYLNQAISLLSGITLIDVGDDYKTFGVSLNPGEQIRITVVLERERISDAVVSSF
jgi:hypothetical protein